MIHLNVATSDTTINVVEGLIQSEKNNIYFQSLPDLIERSKTDLHVQVAEVIEKDTLKRYFKERNPSTFRFQISKEYLNLMDAFLSMAQISKERPDLMGGTHLGMLGMALISDVDLFLVKRLTEYDTSELIVSNLDSELILKGSDAERVEKMLSKPQPNLRRRKFLQEAREIFLKFEKRSKP